MSESGVNMKAHIKNFIINLFYTFLSIYRILKLYKNNLLWDKFQNEDCVVLGNGPSLKVFLEENLDFLLNKKVICVNNMALDTHYALIKPDYYVLADPAYFFCDVAERFKNLRNDVFDNIVQKTQWKMKIFLPYSKQVDISILKIFKVNSNIEICFYNSIPVKGFKAFQYFCYKNNLGMPIAQNVLIASIYLAINMQFKTVYIDGADHSWFKNLVVSDSNTLCIQDPHFYNEDRKLKIFFKDINDISTWRIDEIMYVYHVVFKQYILLNEYAKQENISVFNITKDSYIDAFERVKL